MTRGKLSLPDGTMQNTKRECGKMVTKLQKCKGFKIKSQSNLFGLLTIAHHSKNNTTFLATVTSCYATRKVAAKSEKRAALYC